MGSGEAGAAWHRRETAGKPLAVILDQAEEAWTRPLGGGEVEGFAALLRALFAVRETRPRGRLVLGFRKEWLAEVLQLLDAEKLFYTRVKVAHLDRDAIEEVVLGPASSDRLQRHYGLEVDPELPARIAGDLAGQGAATIAPILQILLTQMWMQVQAGPASPRFTRELYEGMKRRGLLLDDFLAEQLRALREQRLEAVDSGLVLDLLFFHTTPLGTAESRSAAEVAERYGHRQEIPELVGQCKDRYLLVEGGEGGATEAADRPTTRLAHDTLAPLVRRRFETSALPGQRALRILEPRAQEWQDGKVGPPLDEFDLAQVVAGERGMRVRTPDEERLVAASCRQAGHRRGQRRALRLGAVVGVAMILGAAASAWWQRSQAIGSEARSRDRANAALAGSLVVDHPTEAALALLEVRQADLTPAASSNLYRVLGEPLELTLTGHTGSVEAASFSLDGTRVVTASRDRTARIWDAATGESIATLTGHTDRVRAASFSPDGTRVVTASYDRTARIWDAATGESIATLTGHTGEVLGASFSPDGTRVVTASYDKAQIWNAANGQPIATLTRQKGAIWTATFSPDGTRVVTVFSDGTVQVWNAASGQPILTLNTTALGEAATFSPDGTRVVTASSDHTARIWNAATGQPIATLTGHKGEVLTATFSPDGTRVVTASSDWTERIWDAVTGQPIATLNGHTALFLAATFSPGETRLVTASSDYTARIWNVATGPSVTTLTGHTDAVWAASFSPGGTRVVTASSDHTARIWNAATGQPIATLTGHRGTVLAASFSPDGTRVVTASSDHTARIWNAATGQPIAILTGHTDAVWAASFSPDGTRVVTASSDHTARIWNAATGQPIATLTGHTDAVWAASFSPDGTRVVTASSDHTARIWNAGTGHLITILTGQTAKVRAASFSSDGSRVVTTFEDATVRIWNAATGQPTAILTGHSDNDVWAATFSPDGIRVVTASEGNTARIWNAATGQPIATLIGHTDWVEAATFSPDGTRVVTASSDRTARIWNATTGQPISTLTGHTFKVNAATFSPDGTHVVTVSGDRTARIWPSGGEYLQSLVRGRTHLCLQADFRHATLGESPLEAASHEKVCKVCVPRFFARLEGVPSGDSRTHIAAWRAYRGCLDRAR